VPPRPFLSGFATFGMEERFGLRGVLDAAISETLEFKERVRTSFETALRGKVDIVVSLTSILNKTGARFESGAAIGHRSENGRHLNGRALYRMARARLKSSLTGRPIRPKDLWNAKAIVGWGLDTGAFSDQIAGYWGKPPHRVYAATEGGVMGIQPLGGSGMVFNPYSAFYEFVPLEEWEKSQAYPDYQPDVLQLDEVEPGKTYETVITSFYGMPFVRYRLGHLVRILERDQAGPQFEFIGRSDGLIDIAGFTRIDENTVWEALHRTGASISDWTLRRENDGERLILHLYIETQSPCDEAAFTNSFHANLKQVDPLYADVERMLGIRPLRVTILPAGTFDRYYEDMRLAGEPLTRRVPPRMNAGDSARDRLLTAGNQAMRQAA